MEHLLLEYFKDKPAILNLYAKYRAVFMNVVLVLMLCAAIVAKTDVVRSFSLGIAAGIVLINLGQSVSNLRDLTK